MPPPTQSVGGGFSVAVKMSSGVPNQTRSGDLGGRRSVPCCIFGNPSIISKKAWAWFHLPGVLGSHTRLCLRRAWDSQRSSVGRIV